MLRAILTELPTTTTYGIPTEEASWTRFPMVKFVRSSTKMSEVSQSILLKDKDKLSAKGITGSSLLPF